jgi:hypothetical protein
MRVKSTILIVILLTAAYSTSALAGSDYISPMAAMRFEIASVEGGQEYYNPNEQFSIFVTGKSPVYDADPKAGFHVQASITDETLNKTIADADGKFDSEKLAWQVDFTAPSNPNHAYNLNVYFYCEKEGAPCEATYNRTARAIKTMPLQIRQQ